MISQDSQRYKWKNTQSVTVAVFEALAHHGKYELGDIGCKDIK